MERTRAGLSLHRCRTHLRRLSLGAASVLAVLATAGMSVLSAPSAGAATADSLPISQSTTVGVHNTYDKGDYTYLAQALDAGSSLIELDTWDDILSHKWRVSHSNPFTSDNSCVKANSTADLYTGNRNQNLDSCLSDIKWWLAAHPSAGPVYVKIEMKAGFDNTVGMGPAALDAYIRSVVGTSYLYRPADLLAGRYATLDAAAAANAWPARSALAGKMVVYLIPGTVELGNPTDRLHTDVEYASYLRDLSAAGTIGNATAFPAVLGAVGGDPRSQYKDTSIRPWFVFFDGDASTYLNGIDTSWYDTNHYILVMTDAHSVSPALDDTNPPVADAQARVALLARAHASVVSCDWHGLPAVLSMQLSRG